MGVRVERIVKHEKLDTAPRRKESGRIRSNLPFAPPRHGPPNETTPQ